MIAIGKRIKNTPPPSKKEVLKKLKSLRAKALLTKDELNKLNNKVNQVFTTPDNIENFNN